MKGKFKQLPETMKKQILLRSATSFLFIMLFVIVLVNYGDIYLYLPCLLFAGFLILNAGLLYYNSINGKFISVRGVCEIIEVTGIRKRIKSVTLKLDEGTLKILVKSRLKHLTVGDTVIVYLSDKTPVYDDNGSHLICNYYALETRKGNNQ